MLDLPLPEVQLRLVGRLIEKRGEEIRKEVSDELASKKSDLIERGLMGAGRRSSMSDHLMLCEALQGLIVMQRLGVVDVVDGVIEQAGSAWTGPLADGVYTWAEGRCSAVLARFKENVEAQLRRAGSGDTATEQLVPGANQAVQRFLRELRRDLDIRLDTAALRHTPAVTHPVPVSRGLVVFCSYAHEDRRLRNKLENHMSSLKADGQISVWHDRLIGAGAEVDREVQQHLEDAHIILLLVSSSFLASAYCRGIEVKRAMQKHEAGESRVVPVILRPCTWESEPFAKLKALPDDAKPVTGRAWKNADEALTDVARGIQQVVHDLRGQGEGSGGAVQ